MMDGSFKELDALGLFAISLGVTNFEINQEQIKKQKKTMQQLDDIQDTLHRIERKLDKNE